MLKPQDLLATLTIVALRASHPEGTSDSAKPVPTYRELGQMLEMSDSQAYAAVKRAIRSGLLSRELKPNGQAILTVIHAAKHLFPVQLGSVQRGIPTSHSASPLKEKFASDPEPMVWPSAEGTIRGASVEPLYKSAPAAAIRNAALHELLALVDAIRVGRSREREIALEELRIRLGVAA